MKLSELLPDVIGVVFIETFLQYPIIWSFYFTCYTSPPLYLIFGGRWKLIALFFVIVFLLAILATTSLIPVLPIENVGSVILQPTPSCSVNDSPIRYLHRTLNDQLQTVYYTTTLPESNKSKYYIISSWIPSPGDLVTKNPVQFQLENKTARELPKDHFVRSARSREGDLKGQRVDFYSICGNGGIKLESGHITSNSLESVRSGWYRVSNCKCELSRWWYRSRNEYVEGYVNSHFVRLSQLSKTLLREDVHVYGP